MRNPPGARVRAACLAAALPFLASCAVFQEVADALQNLRRLSFRLDRIHEFRLAGIPLGSVSDVGDLTAAQGIRLLDAFRSRALPADFVLEVLAVNPNDGSGGTTRTVSTLTSLDFRLLIDNEPTITGDIDKAVEIPGTGEATVIPIRLGLDLYAFFAERGHDDLIQLALALGGANSRPSRVALDARPTVTTPYGPIQYPGRITIVSESWSGGDGAEPRR